MAAALGATGMSAIGVGRLPWIGSAIAQGGATELIEPQVFTSVDGILETSLIAQPQSYTELGTMNYGGMVPGPTLRLRPGDLLKLKLVNHLSEKTNLHVHGLHVSPLGHGDNVFVHVMPGDERDYEYQIPTDHPAGLFWYHPHPHELTHDQVVGGMAGAIIIEGDLDELPQTEEVQERLLVVQGPFTPANIVINGLVNPSLRIRSGERQRWRILNATAGVFLNLHLDGHSLHRISADGNYLAELGDTDTLLLAPAERAEVLIHPSQPIESGYALRSLPWGEGIQVEFPLATLFVEEGASGPEEAATSASPMPTSLVPMPDLRGATIVEHREITFRSSFRISHSPNDPIGQLFDPLRVDQTVDLGATEEWIIRNDTDFWHPFHIHVNDFQVVSSNGQEQLEPFVYYKDTLPLPPRSGEEPGEVVLRIPFLDFTGKFVYHCHILFHEDGGMMGIVEVVQPVRIVDGAFDPANVEIVAGTTVRWANGDTSAHTVTADNASFDSAQLEPGDSFSHTFESPGTVAYHCELHPDMRATLVVA
jgi:FtsP/CotA-like multicopper oxidase with cupredoxin domain